MQSQMQYKINIVNVGIYIQKRTMHHPLDHEFDISASPLNCWHRGYLNTQHNRSSRNQSVISSKSECISYFREYIEYLNLHSPWLSALITEVFPERTSYITPEKHGTQCFSSQFFVVVCLQ